MDSRHIAETELLGALGTLRSGFLPVLLTGEVRVRPDPEPA
jgi:hypothetical protein